MKKLLSLLILSGCCLTAMQASAQDQSSSEAQKEQKTAAQEESTGLLYKASVGLNVGTQGLGVEVKVPVVTGLNVRAGGNFLFLQANRQDKFGEENARMEMKTNFHQVQAIADYQPFAKAGSFVSKLTVSAGAAYYFQAEGKFNFQPTDTYYYGQIGFGPEEIGVVDATVNWNRLAPYAGLGFTDVKLANRLNLNVGVGVFHFQSPEVSFTGTKMVADNSANNAIVERNMKDYRWMPSLQVGVSYPFNF